MAILSTSGLKKVYGKGENEVHALDGIGLEIERGEFVSVVGTSGSGKSTVFCFCRKEEKAGKSNGISYGVCQSWT